MTDIRNFIKEADVFRKHSGTLTEGQKNRILKQL